MSRILIVEDDRKIAQLESDYPKRGARKYFRFSVRLLSC